MESTNQLRKNIRGTHRLFKFCDWIITQLHTRW